MTTPTFLLNSGTSIPAIGYGCFKVDPAETRAAVRTAIEVGYRHVDTASFYGNEEGVGAAIRDSGIARDEVFVTSKAWTDELGTEETRAACNRSLERLGLDYLDLYLIHWPRPRDIEAWATLEELHREGLIRAIGLSNYPPHLLEKLIKESSILPAVNQIELHPRLQLADWLEACRTRGVAVEAWAPIMRGQVGAVDELVAIGRDHGKSAAQVTLRWHHQRGVIVIPKSVNPDRMRENLAIFDFELSADEMARIAALDEAGRIGPDPAYMYEHGAPPKR